MSKNIKLFNMERTFSNALKRFMNINFDVNFVAPPWKHGQPIPPDEFDNLTGMIFPVKNPYANLNSYFDGWRKRHLLRNHYQNNQNDILSKHIDKMPNPNQTLRHAPIHKDEEFIRTWCEKYNRRMEQYLGIANSYDNALIIRHEDFINDEDAILSIISNKLDLEPEYDEFKHTEQEIGTGGDEKDQEFDKSYYTDKKYLADLTETQKEILQSEIDWDLAERYDYKKLSDSEFDVAPSYHDGSLKILFYGDWNPYTGFGRVSRNILLNLPSDWEFQVLGINYEPHNQQADLPRNIRVHRAQYGRDSQSPYGIQETLSYVNNTSFDYDIMFILQDPFIMSQVIGQRQNQAVSYIQRIREVVHNRSAKLSMYFPIDTPTPNKQWLQPVLTNVDEPVTYTQWAKDMIDKQVHNKDLVDNLDVIYHGVDVDDFQDTDKYDRDKMCEQFQIHDSEFNILYIGANQRRKDIPKSVMGAYCELYQEHPQTNIWLKTKRKGGNSGHDLRFIRKTLRKMYDVPPNKIDFVGKDGEDGYIAKEYINALYNMADVVFLPSLEGWGLPVTEAYATKTPTVVGNHGALKEVGADDRSVQISVPDDLDHKSWFTLDNDVVRTHIDIDEFVHKMGRLSNGKLIDGKKRPNVDKAYDWVQELQWQNIADQWEEKFRKLV